MTNLGQYQALKQLLDARTTLLAGCLRLKGRLDLLLAHVSVDLRATSIYDNNSLTHSPTDNKARPEVHQACSQADVRVRL